MLHNNEIVVPFWCKNYNLRVWFPQITLINFETKKIDSKVDLSNNNNDNNNDNKQQQ